MSVVVSDTSPIHYLVECEAIGILPVLFKEVLIPPAVANELQHEKTPMVVKSWIRNSPDWLIVKAPASSDATLNVDQGEMEAILPRARSWSIRDYHR